jgi:3-hydroxyisobutyrate dehydrogenase
MEIKAIGFIGLGRMGAPMAARLVDAGYKVSGYDRAGTVGRLPQAATAESSVAEIAIETDLVFLSVPDGNASVDICGQIAAIPDPRARVVVDLSTIGIAAAQQATATLRAAGIAYVDAPVSGGVAGARAGTLAMMIGGPADLVERLDPVFEVLARNRFRVGDDPGHGQAMKLVNNYVAATSLAATSEATVFGARVGLDLETMVEVLNASSGRSAASEDKFPSSILPGSYDYGFAGALMTKDVGLYLQSAEQAGVPRELARAVAAVWQRFNATHPDADFTYIHKYFEGESS